MNPKPNEAKAMLGPKIYGLPQSNQLLVFHPEVLEVFLRFRQTSGKAEAGGLLFAEFDLPKVTVVRASAPNRFDKRSFYSFWPNRFLQRKLIQKEFQAGRHFIGEWHTHPETRPSPSSIDKKSMSDSFAQSRHDLHYFVMVIVGNDMGALDLWVSAHNERGLTVLQEQHTLSSSP